MTAAIELDGPRFGPKAGAARELVILLHGVGADGNDLIGLAPHFAQALPEAAFVSPHAPFPFDMAPFGRQWFSLQTREPAEILDGVRAAATHLDAFIDKELTDHELGDDRLALIGFSQGTMVALHVALRRSRPCAALIGYSGMLAAPELLAGEIKSRPPVLLIHGEVDEVVGFPALATAEAALKASRVPVSVMARPGLGHGIDQPGIGAAIAMLRQYLGAKDKA